MVVRNWREQVRTRVGRDALKAELVLLALSMRNSYFAVSLLLLCAGLALWLWSDGQGLRGDMANAMFTSGTLGIFIQLFFGSLQKRDFLLSLRQELSGIEPSLGVGRMQLGHLSDDQVEEALRGAQKLSLICLFDSRWVDFWQDYVADFLKQGGEIELCVPDPLDGQLMAVLAGRHGTDPTQYRASVLRIISMFEHHAKRQGKNSVEVRVIAAPGPAHTAYLIEGRRQDGWGMVRVYDHLLHESQALVEFSFDEGGRLFEHYRRAFDAVWELARPWRHQREHRRPFPRDVAVIGPGHINSNGVHARIAESVGKIVRSRKKTLLTGAGSGVMAAASRGYQETARRAEPLLVSPFPVVRVDGDSPEKQFGEDWPNELMRKSLGIHPGLDTAEANDYQDLVWLTGSRERRNVDVVDNASLLVAVGCNDGTLIEILLARQAGLQVLGVDMWLIDHLIEQLNEVDERELMRSVEAALPPRPAEGSDDGEDLRTADVGREEE